MNDLEVNFDALRLSTLRKAICISKYVDGVTLGPNSIDDSKENWNPDNNEKDIKNTSNDNSLDKVDKSLTNNRSTNITFSIKKILLENEKQRKEEVHKVMEKKKEEMSRFTKEMQEEMALLIELQAEKRKQRTAEEEKKLEQERILSQQDEIESNQRMKQQLQRSREKRKSILLNLEKEAEEEQRYQERVNQMEQFGIKLDENYHQVNIDLSEMIKYSISNQQIVAPYSSKLKELKQDFEKINASARSGQITDNDISIAQEIVKQSVMIVERCKIDIEVINKQYNDEIAKKQNDLQLAQEEALQQQQKQQQQEQQQYFEQTQSSNVNPPQYEQQQQQQQQQTQSYNQEIKLPDTPPNEMKIINESKIYLSQYCENNKEIFDNSELKNLRLKCKSKIQNKLNTFGSQDNKSQEIVVFINNEINNMHPQASSYCQFILANKLIFLLKSQHPDKIPHIANAAVDFGNALKDFKDLMLAMLFTKYPILVPELLNTDDQQDIKTVSNIMQFYGSMIMSDRQLNPYGLDIAWKWLANILNTAPKLELREVAATAIRQMLVTVGPKLWHFYPKQFLKLLHVILYQYYDLSKSLTNSQSTTLSITNLERLKIFAEEFIQQQQNQLV